MAVASVWWQHVIVWPATPGVARPTHNKTHAHTNHALFMHDTAEAAAAATIVITAASASSVMPGPSVVLCAVNITHTMALRMAHCS